MNQPLVETVFPCNGQTVEFIYIAPHSQAQLYAAKRTELTGVAFKKGQIKLLTVFLRVLKNENIFSNVTKDHSVQKIHFFWYIDKGCECNNLRENEKKEKALQRLGLMMINWHFPIFGSELSLSTELRIFWYIKSVGLPV